jgi:hypothetical protein
MSHQPLSIEEMQLANARMHLMSKDEITAYNERLMASLSPETRTMFSRLEAEAKPTRPELTTITADALRALSGQDLDQAICQYVEKSLAEADNDRSALLQLPRGLQVFYLSFILEVEVMNGGVNQFFWNSSSQMADLVPAALRELGSPAAAKIFEEAQLVANIEATRRTSFKEEETLKAFMDSYKETALSSFDDPLCALAENFPSLRAIYVRVHEDLFLA